MRRLKALSWMILIWPLQSSAQEIRAEPVVVIDDERLFRVSSAELGPNGNVWVGNSGSGEILAFGPDGSPVTQFGRFGEGPGEFSALVDVSVSVDRVFATDHRLGRVSEFTLAGELIETWRIPGSWWVGATWFDRLSDGSFVGLKETADPDEMIGHVEFTASLYRFHKNGDTLRLRSLRGVESFYEERDGRVYAQPFPLARRAVAAVGAAQLAAGWTGSADVSVLDFESGGELRVTWSPTNTPVSQAALEREKRHLLGIQEERGLTREEERVFQSVPMPETFPEFAELLVDDRGRTWIGLFSESRSDPKYIVYEGRTPLARVVFPGQVRILGVRGDRAVGVARNNLDVERLVIFEFLGLGGGAF